MLLISSLVFVLGTVAVLIAPDLAGPGLDLTGPGPPGDT